MSELLKKSMTRDLMRFSDGEKIAVLIHFFLRFPDMQDEKKPFVYFEYMDEKFEIELGNSTDGNIRRVLNFIKKFGKTVEKTAELIEKYENSIADTEKYLKKTSSYHSKIKELEAQLADILRELEEAEKIYEPEPLY